jgi:hypothetical protein
MKRKKDTQRIKQMLGDGKISLVDPESGYKYNLCGVCPRDNHDCLVSRYDKTGGRVTEVVRVVFKCSLCGNEFTPEPEEMYLI